MLAENVERYHFGISDIDLALDNVECYVKIMHSYLISIQF